MMNLQYLYDIVSSPTCQHIFLISALFLFVWPRALFNRGMLIDDKEGIAIYSDRWDEKTQKVINTYKQKDSKEYRNTALNFEIGFPAWFLRWFRINLGKKHTVIGKNKQGHEVYGYIQSPFRHHLFSLVCHYTNLILAYFLFSKLFGSNIAVMTVALFSVFPIACQAIAWISGIAYPLSLMGTLLALNCVVHISSGYTTILTTAIFTSWASFILLAGGHVWVILLVLGRWPEAIVAGIVTVAVIARQWGGVVSFRKKAFKDQNMGKSTIFKPRNILIMVKTVWYYVHFVTWPMKLGLFHTWGYHYEDKIERFDRMFFLGFLCLCGMAWAFIAGPLIVKFGIVWFLIYVATFLNAITAQQFVVDRYLFIPSLGFCLIVSYLLQGFLPLYFFILGLYAMRTIVHIPTFRSEIDFYISNSNTSNFLDNEVALGNLGVIYMHHGMPGSAADAWMKSAKINEFYDVPWYNLYSLFKTNGMLDQAKEYLAHCLNSKTVHFQDQWKKEMDQLSLLIQARSPMGPKLTKLNQLIKEVNHE